MCGDDGPRGTDRDRACAKGHLDGHVYTGTHTAHVLVPRSVFPCPSLAPPVISQHMYAPAYAALEPFDRERVDRLLLRPDLHIHIRHHSRLQKRVRPFVLAPPAALPPTFLFAARGRACASTRDVVRDINLRPLDTRHGRPHTPEQIFQTVRRVRRA